MDAIQTKQEKKKRDESARIEGQLSPAPDPARSHLTLKAPTPIGTAGGGGGGGRGRRGGRRGAGGGRRPHDLPDFLASLLSLPVNQSTMRWERTRLQQASPILDQLARRVETLFFLLIFLCN